MFLVVTHSCLAPPLVEVVVGLVDVDTKLTEDAKIFSLETVLLIHRVADIQMMLMTGAFAGVPSKEYLSIAKWQIPHPPYGPSVSSIDSPVYSRKPRVLLSRWSYQPEAKHAEV